MKSFGLVVLLDLREGGRCDVIIGLRDLVAIVGSPAQSRWRHQKVSLMEKTGR